MEREGNINCDTLVKLSKFFGIQANYFLYGETLSSVNPIIIIYRDAKSPNERINIKDIPVLATEDYYEKIVLLGMRNLSRADNKEIYKFVLEKIKKM